MTALALLTGLQYVVAAASIRSRRVERLVKSEPTLIYCDGFLPGAMRRERVTEDELRQDARCQKHPTSPRPRHRPQERRHPPPDHRPGDPAALG